MSAHLIMHPFVHDPRMRLSTMLHAMSESFAGFDDSVADGQRIPG